MGAHLALDRPYWPWLFLHVYDYGMFTGWPLVILAGLGMWRVWVKVRLRQPLSDGDVLAIAVLATLFAIDLSGAMRGESGRILLFLTPFVLPLAASVLMTERSGGSDWIITAGQVVTALVMIAFLRVMGSEFKELPPAAPPAVAQTLPAAKLPSGAVFGDAFHLMAFSGAIKGQPDSNGQGQSTLVLWLEWESSQQVDRPQVLSLTPITPDGRTAGDAVLRQPLDGGYQTTCWLPRSGLIRDRMKISFPEPSQEGSWWVSLSMADMETGEKMKVVGPNGERDDQVRLGPFYPK
jgi:hypothetical protein